MTHNKLPSAVEKLHVDGAFEALAQRLAMS
jgi:hypothetical protein